MLVHYGEWISLLTLSKSIEHVCAISKWVPQHLYTCQYVARSRRKCKNQLIVSPIYMIILTKFKCIRKTNSTGELMIPIKSWWNGASLLTEDPTIVTISRVAMISTESDSSQYALFDLQHERFASIHTSLHLQIQISITRMQWFSTLTLYISWWSHHEKPMFNCINLCYILCETTAALVTAAALCGLCNKVKTNTTISKFL